MIRAMVSDPPPGVDGTMILIVLEVWAEALLGRIVSRTVTAIRHLTMQRMLNPR